MPPAIHRADLEQATAVMAALAGEPCDRYVGIAFKQASKIEPEVAAVLGALARTEFVSSGNLDRAKAMLSWGNCWGGIISILKDSLNSTT